MLVFFTARRLKPGAWEQFRRAWDPGDNQAAGLPARLPRAQHPRRGRGHLLRPLRPDEGRLPPVAREADEAGARARRGISAFVENEHVSGVFEVIDTVDP